MQRTRKGDAVTDHIIDNDKRSIVIFISHSKEDKEIAEVIADYLRKTTTNKIWLDKWELQPGDSIGERISNALANCTVFILIWSKNAAKSNWVKQEFEAILQRIVTKKTKIIPILLDKTPAPLIISHYFHIKLDRESAIQLHQVCCTLFLTLTTIKYTRINKSVRKRKGGRRKKAKRAKENTILRKIILCPKIHLINLEI